MKIKIQQPQKRKSVVEAATAYVNRQLEIMKRHGSAPRLTQKERRELINRVVEASL
jgi:hypothetical protein